MYSFRRSEGWYDGRPVVAGSTPSKLISAKPPTQQSAAGQKTNALPQFAPPQQPAQQTATALSQTGKRIPVRLSGKTYIVPVLINRSIWQPFMIDTGASEMMIPVDLAKTLYRGGYITKEDIGGDKNYVLADGGTVRNTQFRIDSLQIGEGDNAVIAQNVVGSIGGPGASLLLGQSFLRQFRSTFDNKNSLLIVDAEPQAAPTFVPPTAAPQPRPVPIAVPAMRQYSCNNPPPMIKAIGIVAGAVGDHAAFITSWESSCARKYNSDLQRWQAETQRIQILNQQRGY